MELITLPKLDPISTLSPFSLVSDLHALMTITTMLGF
jgi:hypothetical protein